MTITSLAAGGGYRYLTRHVAREDVGRGTEGPAGVRGLADPLDMFLARTGNDPGYWMGTGAAAIDVRGDVTESQMHNLFAEARHPDFQPRSDALVAAMATTRNAPKDLSAADLKKFRAEAVRMLHFGQRFRTYRTVEERVRDRVKRAEAKGTPLTGEAYEEAERQEIERGTRHAVSGWQLTFADKNLSILWALGDKRVQAVAEAAHHAAIVDVIGWLEREVARARSGAGGVAHHAVEGLIVAAFDHRTNRILHPYLHTHAVLSAKVRVAGHGADGKDGQWLALDGKALYKAAVTASERYNTRVEDELRTRLGVKFIDRPGTGVDGKAPVRQIVGLSPELVEAFSARHRQIERAYDKLIAEFRQTYHRYPTRKEQLNLGERAYLLTRPTKPTGSTAAGEREQWHLLAQEILGADPAQMIASVLDHPSTPAHLSGAEVQNLAVEVLAAVQDRRATWTSLHVQAEALRVTRDLHIPDPAARDRLIADITGRVLSGSLPLTPDEQITPAPELTRADGLSVFRPPASTLFTSRAILTAETQLLAATSLPGPRAHLLAVEHALGAAAPRLSDDQAHAVRSLAGDGQRLSALIGPAGSGKTTTLRTLAQAWTAGRTGTVMGMAVSANASAILGESLGDHPAENIAKWLWESGEGNTRRQERLQELRRRGQRARSMTERRRWRGAARQVSADIDRWQMRRGQLIVIDEAGMVPTLTLQKLLHQAEKSGAKLLLVGDWRQLAAIQAGGALRLIDTSGKAAHLTSVWRFVNKWEANASLQVRDGRTEAALTYAEHGRIVEGSREEMREAIYTAWRADEAAGRTALMLTVTVEEAAELAGRARHDLVKAGVVQRGGILLADGNRASVGDRIVTRDVDRTLTYGSTDYVKNGDQWYVQKILPDGSLRVRATHVAQTITLPAAYVLRYVDLAYATTITRAQGMTVDAGHAMLTPGMSREQTYPAITRGRLGNWIYAITRDFLDVTGDGPPAEPSTGVKVLQAAIAASTADLSATETRQAEQHRAGSLHTLVTHLTYAVDLLEDLAPTPSAAADPDAPAQITDMAELLHRHLPEDKADDVLASPAYEALEHALRVAQRRGMHLDTFLPSVFTSREVQTVRDLASVLHYRVEHRTPDPAPSTASPAIPGVPGWLRLPTAGDPNDGRLGTYIATTITAIRDRIAGFADRAAARPDLWSGVLGPLPTDPGRRARWLGLAAEVGAYRDLYGVTGASALGDRPDNQATCCDQLRAYNSVRNTIIAWQSSQRSDLAAQADELTAILKTAVDNLNSSLIRPPQNPTTGPASPSSRSPDPEVDREEPSASDPGLEVS